MSKILIADDDKVIREKLIEIFEKEGHRVKPVSSGKKVQNR